MFKKNVFLILTAFYFLLTNKSVAQNVQANPEKLHAGLGFEVGLPTGQLGDFYNFSIGGTVRLQYDASTNFYVTAEGGAGFETNNGGSTKLLLSPGFGYTSSRSGLDLGLRYDNISGQRSRSGQFVARIGYDF